MFYIVVCLHIIQVLYIGSIYNFQHQSTSKQHHLIWFGFLVQRKYSYCSTFAGAILYIVVKQFQMEQQIEPTNVKKVSGFISRKALMALLPTIVDMIAHVAEGDAKDLHRAVSAARNGEGYYLMKAYHHKWLLAVGSV